jgi:hypothetical protein
MIGRGFSDELKKAPIPIKIAKVDAATNEIIELAFKYPEVKIKTKFYIEYIKNKMKCNKNYQLILQ